MSSQRSDVVDDRPEIPDTMLAAVWQGESTELQVERIPTPSPLDGEVLIKVAACGVCHSDLHGMKGEIAFPAPAVFGHEVSGHVAALGAGVDSFAVGDRVIGAFVMPCGWCEQCERGRDDMCATFFAENRLKGNLFDGSSRLHRPDGSRLSMYSMAGLAEYSVVPVTALTRLPDPIPLNEAAVLGCAAFTAFGAVQNAQLQPGETVAVVAIGGVGSSILQVAAHLGASKIIAVDVSDEKLAAAEGLGATATVNSAAVPDPVAAVHEIVPGGVDVVFEALGHPQTFELANDLLADGGRMIAIGIAAGDAAASVPITRLVRRGHTIRGSFGARTRRDLPGVVALVADGGFDVERAVTQQFALSEVNEAYAKLQRGEISGRAIIVM